MFYILICLLFGLLQYNPYLYMCWMPRTGLSFKLLQKETSKVPIPNLVEMGTSVSLTYLWSRTSKRMLRGGQEYLLRSA